MQTRLIQIKDYLLLIDEDAEIQPNDLIERDGNVYKCTIANKIEVIVYKKDSYAGSFPPRECSKLIAYYPLTKEAKELDLPLLPNPFEAIANILFTDYISKYKSEFNPNTDAYSKGIKIGFMAGYKAVQSNKQFSLEDMIKAIEMAREQSEPYYGGGGLVLFEPIYENKYTEEEIIQSLSTQKLPKEFIPEYEVVYFHGNGYYNESELSIEVREKYNFMKESKLKTITNSEGKQELVGIYKY